VASLAYLTTSWEPGQGLAQNSDFWLRLVYLWVMASFAAVLSLDSREEVQAREQAHAAQLRQMEQLAALGQVSGEVAHGIKGPLTTILVNADVLLERHGKLPGVAAEVRGIQEEVARCRDVLQDLLELGRIEDMDYDPFDLRDPVRSALERMSSRLARKKVRVETEGLERPASVLGDPSLLFEAVYEVLQNAEQALAPGGSVRITLRSRRKQAWWASAEGDRREYYELTVEDDGPGMDAPTLARVFDPFFTTKGGAGTGLGLPAALRILHKHSGTLEAASDGPGRGSRFVLSVPVFRPAVPAA
ncbi:MAG: HAMP domain-containing histidine kinase, partial [Elusimicrobia bacterium]|nr:HAMP domain-containing histidine kinase [Elusimicrobiota bacterium]